MNKRKYDITFNTKIELLISFISSSIIYTFLLLVKVEKLKMLFD